MPEPRSNLETNVDILETRYRSGREQSTLNIELGLAGSKANTSAAFGSGGGTITGGIVSELTGGGGGPGGGRCPEIHQYVMIRSDINTPIPVRVKYVEVGMYLWNPITGTFEKLVRADVIEDQELWGVGINRPTLAIGSRTSPLIQGLADTEGIPLFKKPAKAVLTLKGMCRETEVRVEDLGECGTVKHLETSGPTHIFAHGSTMETMVAFHNLKPRED